MKTIYKLLAIAMMGVFSACTSPVSRINDSIHDRDNSFINSKTDYMYHESKSYFYVVEGANPLADMNLRRIAFAYANAAGMAQYSRDMAYSVTHKRDKNFKLTPNWFEEEKRYNRDAENYDAEATGLKQQLESAIKSGNFSSEQGGIWVYHKLSYKEYVYNSYIGPYIKESISLYSADGEKELFTESTRFSEKQLTEILNMTGTKFTVKSSHDYKM